MINFTEIFIRRPVLSTVLSLFILCLGIASYFSLTLREFPKIDNNVIYIAFDASGYSPEIIESNFVAPIEDAVSTVDGIDYIASESGNGYGRIAINFKLDYKLDTALIDVTSKTQKVRRSLPADVKDPSVVKYDPNTKPILEFGFFSDKMTQEEITDYLARIVQPQLQVIDGVGTTDLDGAKEYAMRLWLNPYAMAAHNISPQDLYDAINSTQIQTATGSMENLWQHFAVNALTNMSTVEQFNEMVIKSSNGQLTKLRDIGRAEIGVKDRGQFLTIDNKPGVGIPITPKGDANPLDVADNVKQAVKKMEKFFPAGLKSVVAVDLSEFIHASIAEIHKAFFVSIFFVLAIVFVFLGSGRVLLVPAVTIPLSIVGVFSIMLALGYSLNILTLLALVLAIGMVVDDAIVVVENIHRHMKLGKSPLEAAIAGAKEIQFAVISITLTLAAVYAPIGFTSGLTKVLFKEFAFTLAGTVIISGFVALTLSPMMCSKIMTPTAMDSAFAKAVHNITAKIGARYETCLVKILGKRKQVLLFLGIAFVLCYLIYALLPHDLAPQEDVGFITTEIQAPATANIDYTRKYADKIAPILQSIPEITHYGIHIYDNNHGDSMALLKPWSERKQSSFAIIDELRHKLTAIPALKFHPSNPRFLPGSRTDPIALAIQTTGSFEELNQVTHKLLAAIKTNPKLQDVDTSFKIDQPQLDVVIDKNKAGSLGISMHDIVGSINYAFGQPEAAKYTVDGRGYYVVPQLEEQFKDRFDTINNLQLRTNTGTMVPLSNLLTIKESIRPRTLAHFQQMRYASIEGLLPNDYTLGEALKFIESKAKEILPPHMMLDYRGQSRQFMEASGKMMYTFILSMIFIFLILAAQFESFRAPLVVMFSVPLSILGALLTLFVFGGTLNIYSQIGLITLVGLISKHGILMVEFANQLCKQGVSQYEAIIKAAQTRLRPILMTTLAMVLGALPLALATGAGAAGRRQIGMVIVGGMIIGTTFTLFVIPTMYTILKPMKKYEKISST